MCVGFSKMCKIPDLQPKKPPTEPGHRRCSQDDGRKDPASLDKCPGRIGAMGQMATFVEAAFQNSDPEETNENLCQ